MSGNAEEDDESRIADSRVNTGTDRTGTGYTARLHTGTSYTDRLGTGTDYTDRLPDDASEVDEPIGSRRTPGTPPPSAKPTLDRTEAATVVQKAWRRYIDVQVYKYYRDMINFKSRGDPNLMLRCINPSEAKVIDSAAGTFIRFRLGGIKFPPNIYYKIYTRRPVQDVGANAPRDYTALSCKQLPAKYKNSRILTEINNKTTKDGWYRRWENNGWRLVPDRLVLSLETSIPGYHDNKRKEFHPVKFVRRKEIEKHRKRRKIRWMRKMYEEGFLQAKTGTTSEQRQLIDETTRGLIDVAENLGEDTIDDWEVNELLKWTDGLNYEDYAASWSHTGTTECSADNVTTKKPFIQYHNDPFEFTIKRSDETVQEE